MTLQIKQIEKPFQIWSHLITLYNLRLLKAGLSHPFTTLDKATKLWSNIVSERLPWLVKTEEALRSFKERINKIKGIEGMYVKLREAYDRTPAGYITEIRVIIPDSNRKLEYQIYEAFGELLRTSRPLLFDLHIIKLRGRKPEETIPEGFWRYEWTSNLIF